MMSDADELQAAEYRRMMQAREDNKLLREQQLAGSKAAYDRVLNKTRSLIGDKGWEPNRKVIDDES